MTRYMIALLLFTFPAILTAQEPGSEPEANAPAASGDSEGEKGEVTIVLEEPAKTVEEALERRTAKEAEAQKHLDAAQKLFDDTMAAADRHAVADLAVIARQAVADGKLGEAAEAWTEVERLEPENEQAKAFFKVVGRDEPSADSQPVRDSDLVGNWKWMTGTEMEFRRGGVMILKANGKVRRGRWEIDPKSRTVIFIDSRGNHTDQTRLTHDGKMLEGFNKSGVPVWGVKIN